jgi:deoxyribose-phosphate aldolase
LRKDDDLDTKLDKVKFIRNNISDNIGIKVSGGIRNSDDVNKFRNYIDRIGTSVVI